MSYWLLTEKSNPPDGGNIQNPPGKKVLESSIHVHFVVSNFSVYFGKLC